jgi:hypothetical protein
MTSALWSIARHHHPIAPEVEAPVVFTPRALKKWKQQREPHTTGGPPFFQVVAVFSACTKWFSRLSFSYFSSRAIACKIVFLLFRRKEPPMPVLASTDDRVAPKSIIRHRPLGDSRSGDTKDAVLTTVPIRPRASRPHAEKSAEEVATWQQFSPATSITRRSSAGKRTRATTVPKTPTRERTRVADDHSFPETRLPHARSRQHRPIKLPKAHPLFYLGLGMTAMLLLWFMVSAAVNWAQTTLDDLHYGYPRTYQTDAWVGHNEQTGTPSHFIALNLHGHIEVIEIAGGDPAHTRMYSGPQLYGPGSDLAPVTLRFLDVNGDHKPDMIVSFQNTHLVYINDQGGFRPMQPSERPQVEQALQRLGL